MEIKLNIKKEFLSLIKISKNINFISEIKKLNPDKVVIITDKNIYKKYSKNILFKKYRFLITSKKNINNLTSIINFFIENKLTRNSIVIAFGGGTISDIVGFATSIYMRAIKWISIPTTFLSQIDASIGGKTAIDFKNIKNIVGSFHFPSLVLIDKRFSISQDENFNSGIGELYKYYFISKNKTLKDIIKGVIKKDKKLIEKAIDICAKLKLDIVKKDPFDEKGIREILNFAHTMGHALEKTYNISHGDAIYLGIKYSLILSKNLNIINKENFDNYFSFLNLYNFKIKLKSDDFEKIYKLISYDKKNRGYQNYFLLLNKNKIEAFKNIDKKIIKKSYEELCQTYS